MLKRPSRPLLSAALLLALSTSFAAPVLADDAKPREGTITVSGEGDATIAPDLAVLNFSVLKIEPTARAAMDANTKAMADVIAAMKKHGIESRDLQTSGFSIEPQYTYAQNPDGSSKPPEFRGYQVINSLTIRVRDLAKLGDIMDEAVTMGINQGGSVSFGNVDAKPVIAEARKAAVADAMAKAKALTEAAGVKLGRILDISEGGAAPRPMPMLAMAAKDMAPASAPVPVEAGENAYHASVSMTIALDQ